MQCPRCEFENMPGMDRCFKCGSTLQIEMQCLDANPPRMAAWKKPFRNFIRTLRRLRILPGESLSIHPPQWLSKSSKDILSVFLSIIPGLGHLLQKSFNTISWYVVAWLVCLAATIFFYGSFAGYLFLGFCLVLHAWIAIHSGLIKVVTASGHRLIAILILGSLLWVVYLNIGRFVFQDIDRIHSSVTIPYYDIRINDYLLANRISPEGQLLPRGSIVIANLPHFGVGLNGPINGFRRPEVVASGQIIAFENEMLRIEENTFYVDEVALEKDKYPVPMWLRGRALSVTIPKGHYFIASEYNVNARGIALNNEYISDVCTIATQSVESKVFMLWSSLTRRKFIRDYE